MKILKLRQIIAAATVMLLFLGCNNHRQYVLILTGVDSKGNIKHKTETIYANNDKDAYHLALVMFQLNVYTYSKMNETKQQFITRTIQFRIADSFGRNLDSLLPQPTRDSLRSVVNIVRDR